MCAQYRRQSLASTGAKESFMGHIVSDTLGKILATAPCRGPIFLVVGQAPWLPADAGGVYATQSSPFNALEQWCGSIPVTYGADGHYRNYTQTKSNFLHVN